MKRLGPVAVSAIIMLSGCLHLGPGDATSATSEPRSDFHRTITGAIVVSALVSGPNHSIALTIPLAASTDPHEAAGVMLAASVRGDWLTAVTSGRSYADVSAVETEQGTVLAESVRRTGDGVIRMRIWNFSEDYWHVPVRVVAMAGAVTNTVNFELWLNGTDIQIVDEILQGPAWAVPLRIDEAGTRVFVKEANRVQLSLNRRGEWKTDTGTIAKYTSYEFGAMGPASAADWTIRHSESGRAWERTSFDVFKSNTVAARDDIPYHYGTLLTGPPGDWELEVDARASTHSYGEVLLVADVPFMTDDTRLW